MIHSIGHCNYNVHCRNTVGGIKLKKECQYSTNYNVSIDVTLRDASDVFHNSADLDLLAMVTKLTVSGNWPQTNLSFLDSMYRLKSLNIINNNIFVIYDSPFGHLSRLENLNLSRNHLTDIEELFQFDYKNKLKKLSLAHNSISEIPGDTFSELTSLLELDLSYNNIYELIEEPFSNLTSLKKLILSYNKIKNINGALNNLLDLKHLYLRNNYIENIELESIKIISHLETFDVAQNQLVGIKPLMFSRHWYHFDEHTLCKIILSENHITHILNSTSENYNAYETKSQKTQRIDVFTELDLSKNSISHIEYDAFQSMDNMISLDLSCNKLFTFEVNADDLRYVRYLNLSTNSLHTLHFQSFVSMKYLQNLDLSHNQMDYFPDQSLSNNYMIKLINMTYNDIASLQSLRITFNHVGGVLDLSNNSISKLNLPRGDAVGLSILILSSNNISDLYLIKLSHQSDLEQIDLTYNYIQELDKSSLQLPEKLAVLDLSHNSIVKIGPSTFSRVNQLKTLRLSHNYLSEIEYGAFQGLSDLQNLDLAYNRIVMLDSKVMMDLKHLIILSLRHNGMVVLDHRHWIKHMQEINVYLDSNNFACDWLATALSDYYNGFSKMRPTVLNQSDSGHSIEGIPCEQTVGNLMEIPDKTSIADERLLVINQKILEAVLEQTSFLRKYLWRVVRNDAQKNYTN
ncbi:unnamed protein product [Leptidea sinapis]|uniref:LRRCT domain-containing protein n=1 Tax=Leptidea sinapis TaxID=189913 RepID=A0A5E4Q7X1_9NEOP|nr:unnamed protein product [Leptidea sinapis]